MLQWYICRRAEVSDSRRNISPHGSQLKLTPRGHFLNWKVGIIQVLSRYMPKQLVANFGQERQTAMSTYIILNTTWDPTPVDLVITIYHGLQAERSATQDARIKEYSRRTWDLILFPSELFITPVCSLSTISIGLIWITFSLFFRQKLTSIT